MRILDKQRNKQINKPITQGIFLLGHYEPAGNSWHIGRSLWQTYETSKVSTMLTSACKHSIHLSWNWITLALFCPRNVHYYLTEYLI